MEWLIGAGAAAASPSQWTSLELLKVGQSALRHLAYTASTRTPPLGDWTGFVMKLQRCIPIRQSTFV
jgi:signal-transduction protein with cAMP-binding, CBS, and nucleotidyltransferase domain